jgi:hypothetical protein
MQATYAIVHIYAIKTRYGRSRHNRRSIKQRYSNRQELFNEVFKLSICTVGLNMLKKRFRKQSIDLCRMQLNPFRIFRLLCCPGLLRLVCLVSTSRRNLLPPTPGHGQIQGTLYQNTRYHISLHHILNVHSHDNHNYNLF